MIIRKFKEKSDHAWGFNRAWQWEFHIYRWNGRFNFGLELWMTHDQGQPLKEKWWVGENTLGLVYNPAKWVLKNEHFYFDGRHCLYSFGPFEFQRHGLGDCTKCEKER